MHLGHIVLYLSIKYYETIKCSLLGEISSPFVLCFCGGICGKKCLELNNLVRASFVIGAP